VNAGDILAPILESIAYQVLEQLLQLGPLSHDRGKRIVRYHRLVLFNRPVQIANRPGHNLLHAKGVKRNIGRFSSFAVTQ
jgi:hypothetical protein